MQLTGIECGREPFENEPPEQTREHTWRKKSRFAGNPTLAVGREAPTWDDAMRMRMVMEVVTPTVQNCRDADVSPEVLGISSNEGESLGRSLQQQAIDDGLVLIGDPPKRGRQ